MTKRSQKILQIGCILTVVVCFLGAIKTIQSQQPAQSQVPLPTITRNVYVSPQGYLDPHQFSPVVKTMSDAMRIARRGDTILLYGKLRESGVVTPYGLVDVTIRGMAPNTRPGNTTTPNGIMGGSSDWGNNTGNVDNPLLTITNSGWSVQNLHFGAAPNGAAIVLERNIQGDRNANHTDIVGNTFSGGPRGIEDRGGNSRVVIRNNEFYEFKGTAIIGTNTSVAWPLMWKIEDNIFTNNQHNISIALSAGLIRGNIFFRDGFGRSSVTMIRLDGGKNNFIIDNYFSHPSMVPQWVGGAYGGGEGNVWGPNHYSDGTKPGEPREDRLKVGNAN